MRPYLDAAIIAPVETACNIAQAHLLPKTASSWAKESGQPDQVLRSTTEQVPILAVS
jgi:hypothetical protein